MARLTAGPGSSEPRKYVRHNKAIEGFPDTTVAMVISGGHFPGSDSEGFAHLSVCYMEYKCKLFHGGWFAKKNLYIVPVQA